MILLADADKTMDGTGEQRGSFKENINQKETYNKKKHG